MELNEIKKILYKENPKAELDEIRDETVWYSTSINDIVILFKIPMFDTKGASFFSEMDSKYLIRWIDSFISDE